MEEGINVTNEVTIPFTRLNGSIEKIIKVLKSVTSPLISATVSAKPCIVIPIRDPYIGNMTK